MRISLFFLDSTLLVNNNNIFYGFILFRLSHSLASLCGIGIAMMYTAGTSPDYATDKMVRLYN